MLSCDQLLDYMHKEQAKSSPMGIYTPYSCKLSKLKVEPLMILRAPPIVYDFGAIYGWLYSDGLRKQADEHDRWYAERGAISELVIDVMFRALDIDIKWSGLFNFAPHDFIHDPDGASITIGVTSARQGDIEEYTAKQGSGARLVGNPTIHYSYGKIDHLADYLIGTSVRTIKQQAGLDSSDVAVWGAIEKDRLESLMKELWMRGFRLLRGDAVWIPLNVNERGLEGFNLDDLRGLMRKLGREMHTRQIEEKTNEELGAIAKRTGGHYDRPTSAI